MHVKRLHVQPNMTETALYACQCIPCRIIHQYIHSMPSLLSFIYFIYARRRKRYIKRYHLDVKAVFKHAYVAVQ